MKVAPHAPPAAAERVRESTRAAPEFERLLRGLVDTESSAAQHRDDEAEAATPEAADAVADLEPAAARTFLDVAELSVALASAPTAGVKAETPQASGEGPAPVDNAAPAGTRPEPVPSPDASPSGSINAMRAPEAGAPESVRTPERVPGAAMPDRDTATPGSSRIPGPSTPAAGATAVGEPDRAEVEATANLRAPAHGSPTEQPTRTTNATPVASVAVPAGGAGADASAPPTRPELDRTVSPAPATTSAERAVGVAAAEADAHPPSDDAPAVQRDVGATPPPDKLQHEGIAAPPPGAAPLTPEATMTPPDSPLPDAIDDAATVSRRPLPAPSEIADRVRLAMDRLRPIPAGGASVAVELEAIGAVELRVEPINGGLKVSLHSDDPHALARLESHRHQLEELLRDGPGGFEFDLGAQGRRPHARGSEPRAATPPAKRTVAAPVVRNRSGLVDVVA